MNHIFGAVMLIAGLTIAIVGQRGSLAAVATPVRQHWQYGELQYFSSSTSFELDTVIFTPKGLRRTVLQEFSDGKFKHGNGDAYGAGFAKMGQDGWELVSTTMGTQQGVGTTTEYLFKRLL